MTGGRRERQWPRAPGTVRCSELTWPLTDRRQARPAVRAMEASLRRPTEGRAHRPPEGSDAARTTSRTGTGGRAASQKAPSNTSTRPREAPILVHGLRSYDSTGAAAARRGFVTSRAWTEEPSGDGVSRDSIGPKPSAACAAPTSGRRCRRHGGDDGRNPNGARRRTAQRQQEQGRLPGGRVARRR